MLKFNGKHKAADLSKIQGMSKNIYINGKNPGALKTYKINGKNVTVILCSGCHNDAKKDTFVEVEEPNTGKTR